MKTISSSLIKVLIEHEERIEHNNLSFRKKHARSVENVGTYVNISPNITISNKLYDKLNRVEWKHMEIVKTMKHVAGNIRKRSNV